MNKPKLERIFYLHKLLVEGGYPTVGELASKFEVSRRTIERDLEYMRDRLQAPLDFNRERGGYEYTEEFQFPPVHFSEGEVVAIALGSTLLERYKGTPFAETIKIALDKLTYLLPNHITLDLSQPLQAVSFAVDPPRGDPEMLRSTFQTLNRAITRQCQVSLRHRPATRDECTQRLVNPYHLRNSQGNWYLIGFCHLRQEVRIFALDRIEEVTLTSQTFTPPADFSVEEYLGDSWAIFRGEPVEVEISFAARLAPWVLGKEWHPSQRIEEREDGSLGMSVKVSGLEEIKRWVLQFGQDAEVIRPLVLRDRIKSEIQGLVEKYGLLE